ncbi:hypothetical protein FPOA_03757 [Fusarium poae]|uniref:DUF7908 domain-containing protein n=1 Tax=Fusarium poae TaxID=36050 RepID=A0A1B8ARR8_FUSPO|nr:hypothetical protein FPOA_03757 [Fusarium poae]
MKWQSLLALGSIAQLATSLELIDETEDNGVICYTYLSTYLAAVDAGPAPALPTTRGILPPYFTNRSTSAVPLPTFPADRESSIVLQDPDSTVALPTSSDIAFPTEFTLLTSSDFAIQTELTLLTSSDFIIPTEFTDLVSPTAAISSDVSTTTSQAEVTGQAVIFFITPDTTNERRSLVKRIIPGGFVNGVSPVDTCTDADVFQLSDGQLLDNGSPVYYDGEPYKLFASDGTPPDGAITREFASVNGNLVFTSSSLPSTGFCQDDSGQVYITFGSSPPGCDPVLLKAYTVEQCQNGEIPGPDQASLTSSDVAQSPVTASTDISSSAVSSGAQELTSTILTEPMGASSSTDSPSVVTETQSTVTTDETAIVTVDSSSTDLSSQSSLFTSSSSLTLSTTITTESQSVPLLQTSSSTDSTVVTVSTDTSSSSESPFEPSASTVFSTVTTVTDLPFEETTISTTILPQESETSTLLDTTNATAETTATGETTATQTTTTAEDTTGTETTTADEGTTTTDEETTTTAEATTTTSSCDSEVILTTVALLNPTPIFGNAYYDDSVANIALPFNIAGSGQSTVYVSTNGVISLGSGGYPAEPGNRPLPTQAIPGIAVCPYWDDFILDRSRGHSVAYEVFDGQHGTQATFEWVVGRYLGPPGDDQNDDSLFHFTATFYQNFPQIFRFSYYTTTDKGSSATTGVQNSAIESYRQISFNAEGSVQDGTSVFINLLTGGYETVPFDNTECGKGDPYDRSTIFAE